MEMKLKYFLIILSLITSNAIAQEKETPPPPYSEVEDTTRVRKPSHKRPPFLRLPDVIIYGRDTFILLGEKSTAEILTAQIEVKDSPDKFKRSSIGIATAKKPYGYIARYFKNSAKLRYGSYNSFDFDLMHGQRVENFDYLVNLSVNTEGEWYTNANSEKLDLLGKAGYCFVKDFSVVGGGGYRKSNFGYYGFSDDLRGRYTRYTFSLSTLPYFANFSFSEDRLDSSNFAIAKEKRFLAKGMYRFRNLTSKVRYINNTLDETEANLLNTALTMRFSPLLSLGFRLDSYNRNYRLNPYLKIDYNLDKFGIFLTYNPKLVFYGLSEIFAQNNYVTDLFCGVEDRSFAVTAGLDFRLGNRYGCSLQFEREEIKDKPFFEGDSLFKLNKANVSHNKLTLNVGGRLEEEPSEGYRGKVNFVLGYEDYTPRLPYTPDFSLSGRLKYIWKYGIDTETKLSYFSQRYTSNDKRLSPYLLVDMEIGKSLTEFLRVFCGVNNLLDQKYEIFYIEKGQNFYLGLSLVF